MSQAPVVIVVLQRSWNVVGRLTINQDNTFSIESPCYVIRRWGTTGGLGQLAETGPLTETVLDKTPAIRGRLDALIFSIDTNESAWKSTFP